ncbi:MBL fold metallo-hydrolase [Clostridiaceae bacterium 14S0207]|nr:MBL fold metallo-hydrolase [Clostridiaceae bacterium 14S0207]
MELKKINGNTGVILAPTNIGVYTFKSKQCIIIDTGIGNTFARRIESTLDEQGIKPKYIINTHHHSDHTGGNKYFRDNYPGVQVYTTETCKVFLENPHLGSVILYGGYPIKEVLGKPICTQVDSVLQEGVIKINDEKFQILELKGHAEDGIGIVTPDRVCFLGDSLFSHDILEKYSFPFLFNIDDTYKTLKKIKEIDADYFVLGHDKDVLDKEKFLKLIDSNEENLKNYEEQIIELLAQPATKEDLLQNISILNDLPLNVKQYFLNMCTISGFLAYLEEKEIIKCSLEEGKIYYYVG